LWAVASFAYNIALIMTAVNDIYTVGRYTDMTGLKSPFAEVPITVTPSQGNPTSSIENSYNLKMIVNEDLGIALINYVLYVNPFADDKMYVFEFETDFAVDWPNTYYARLNNPTIYPHIRNTAISDPWAASNSGAILRSKNGFLHGAVTIGRFNQAITGLFLGQAIVPLKVFY